MLGAVNASVQVVQVADESGTLATAITAMTDTEDLLALTDVALGPDDAAVLRDSGDGATLEVLRAFPVDVVADGRTVTVDIAQGTVKDAVLKSGVPLSGDDFTQPALSEPVTEDIGAITVHRVTYQETIVQETVPYETVYVEEGDAETSRYHHNILQSAGQEGLQRVTVREKYIDGVYDSSEVVATEMLAEPVAEVFATVHNDVVSPLEAPEGYSVVDGVVYGPDGTALEPAYTMKATGYYSPSGKGASGLGLYYGTFAVDPTLIPYGTKVFIVSTDGNFTYGWAIATDTGAFIHSNRMQVDLFYETYAESAANGAKQVYVYVPEQ